MTRYPGAIFMATGGYHHHIGLNIWNGEGAPPTKENSVGLYEYRIVYEENELMDVIQKATSANVYVKETEIGYVMEDPSKNRILLTTKDRKSTRLNSSHVAISYAVFCLKKKRARRET